MLRISQEALTFDDVLLIPGYSEVLPKDVSLKTRLTRGIELNIPLVSAAMDTVTEARLAIAMAQEGGIGIIHKNMGIEQQAAEVRKVKKHETAIVRDPVTVTPSTKIIELLQMAREYGFSGFPVVEQGELVGIVTGRDLRVKPNAGDTVAAIMTPKDKLVTAREGTPLEEMKAKLYENRIEKMLVVDENFYLRGLVTFRDIEKAKTYPLASKDEQGRLRVGAAVGTGADTGERVAALVAAGVDVVVVDTAHGHSKGVIERVRWVKQTFPDVQEGLLTRVRRLLLARPGDFPDLEQAARELHTSGRSLRRHLSSLGTTYQQVLDDVRKRLALQYLTTTQLPLYEIALLLGFNDSSNFRRAFRKWTGKLPSDYREAP